MSSWFFPLPLPFLYLSPALYIDPNRRPVLKPGLREVKNQGWCTLRVTLYVLRAGQWPAGGQGRRAGERSRTARPAAEGAAPSQKLKVSRGKP